MTIDSTSLQHGVKRKVARFQLTQAGDMNEEGTMFQYINMQERVSRSS